MSLVLFSIIYLFIIRCEVQPIPEETEVDGGKARDSVSAGDENDDILIKTAEDIEQEINEMNEKLEQLKFENEEHWNELSVAEKESSLMEEYDEKIMFYDTEYHQLLNEIEKEQSTIDEYKEQLQSLINLNSDENQEQNMNENQMSEYFEKQAQSQNICRRSSIVIFDNFSSDHLSFQSFQKFEELDEHILHLQKDIQWLYSSKMKLVKNTSTEVNRLRDFIKIMQANIDQYDDNDI